MILTRRSPLASTLEPKDIFAYAQAHDWPGVLIADTTPFSLFECWKLSKKTGIPVALGRRLGDICIYSDTDEGLVHLLNATEDSIDSFISIRSDEFAYRDSSDVNACAALRATAQDCLISDIDLTARSLGEFEFTPQVRQILERSSSVNFHTGDVYFPAFSSNDPDLLYKKTLDGLKRRYGTLTKEIKDRARYEYDIIVDKGFSGYFLIVSDYVLWSKRNGIRVGPGRGSGAGSIVAYALEITELDPLFHKLFFERFLNPERKSIPDFDLDFDDIRRHEAISYVTEKYGKSNVSQIITNGTMKAKAALHDAARVLYHPPSTGARLSAMMPAPIFGREMPLGGCFDETHERYEEASRLREEYASDETAREIIDLAMGMEGATRQWGVHAAGVIICGKPLTEVISVSKDITGFDYPTCESLGAIKFDFLGLRNLTVITDTLRAVKERHGIDIPIDNLPLDDAKTYEMLSSGDAIGVFQLEASGLRNLLRLLKPKQFQDLSAVVALYRPGPMGVDAHTSYARRANGNEDVQYPHPELKEPLEDILGDTYGLIVYQEQVMAIAQRVAGYTLGSADQLRKALDIDTLIPTPNGYKAMKDILVGDKVFSGNGSICKVLNTTEIYDSNNCYEITFSDGSSLICDGDHEWKVISSSKRKSRASGAEEVVDTNFLVKNVGISGTHYSIKNPSAWKYFQQEQIIDPYILGLWLGDGSSNGARYTTADDEILQNFTACGYLVEHKYHELAPYSYRIYRDGDVRNKNSFASELRAYNLIKNKHIPSNYLFSSVEQRFKLLAGLLDSDGTIDKTCSRISITQKNKKLAEQIYMLVSSLGFSPTLTTRNIKKYGTYYIIGWTSDVNPFKLSRKANIWKKSKLLYQNKERRIVSIKKVASRKVKCITVDSRDNTFLAGANGIPTHNCLGKKLPEALAQEYPKFKQGMLDNGYSQDCIDTLWDILIPFAGYSFNRAHSASYGLIAYQTAYLKAHYPVEYMSALMTSVDTKHNKLALYLAECRNMGITVLPPDINDANGEFYAIDDSTIRFGLRAIRSVGDGVVNILTTEREENGAYNSLEDLFYRAHKRGITKAAWQNLILAGGLDEFGTRKELLDSLDLNLKIAADRITASAAGFNDLLSDIAIQLPNRSEFSKDQLLKSEKHVLGLYITGHPLDSLWPIVRHSNPTLIGELTKDSDNRKVRTFAGIITRVMKKTDKEGKPWGIVTLEDPTSETDILVFSNAWPQFAPFAKTEELITLTGFVNYRDEVPAIYANTIFIPNKPDWEKIEITLEQEHRTKEMIEFLKDELTALPGTSSATIFMPNADVRSAIEVKDILITTEAIQNISAMLGPKNVIAYTS